MARTFVYPGSDFDRGYNLLSLLGSFWARTYDGKDQVLSYVQGAGLTANQTYKNLLEVVAALSRFTVPLFHEETLVPITIRKSELNTVKTNTALFDRTAATFDSGLAFDRPEQTTLFCFPRPENMVGVRQIFNKIGFPTVALFSGTDFTIDQERGAIVFANDPFANPGFLRQLRDVNGTTTEEITLRWYCGQFEYDYVFEQFANSVGNKLRTSQGYKDLMNAVITGLIDGGGSAKTLDLALSAICGIPVSAEPNEVVEVVSYDRNGLFIATDKNVYKFTAAAEPLVVVGQVLPAGSLLVRGFDVSEFLRSGSYRPAGDTQELICRPVEQTLLATNLGEYLTTESDDELLLSTAAAACRQIRRDLTTLAVDGGFLSACFYSDLVFENKEVPLEVIEDHPSGYTYVKFGVGGLPADVEFFFDEIHRRGIDQAEQPVDTCNPGPRRGTLAQLLDWRAQPSSQPNVTHLPATINPLRFLIENVLRNNVVVVRIYMPALGANRLGLYNMRQLRQLIPPQTALLVVFEVVADSDTIRASQLITETQGRFVGMAPCADVVSPELIQEGAVSVRAVSGTCQ
jgi:hypothetical protein